MASDHIITFHPNRVQKSFIESRAKADLFSSRMGEGKSAALVWAAFYHTRHNPGATWAIVRDTWENLRRSTLEEFFHWFRPGVFGTWHAGNKEWTWAEGVAQGKVIFLGMDSPDDATKLMSVALGGFALDEPAPALGSVGIDEMIFDMALTRLRQKRSDGSPMEWYAAKLAENNPDEDHWTYRRFVQPGDPEFALWQPHTPENAHNLRGDYYENIRRSLSHRPDLVRRFVDGEFGFQQVGKAVTPQWNDKVHLALGLTPVPRVELTCLWDFGHNPTCIITQKTPLGHWNVLDALVGDGIGTAELIMDEVKPLLVQRYGFRPGRSPFPLRHIGDPAGTTAEQTSIHRSPVRLLRRELGGTWKSGPVKPPERIEPLRAILSRTIGGQGVVQVDREHAKAVWYALRGGWHFHVSRTGITSTEALKDKHSHPGDAMGYGAAVLFPMGKLVQPASSGLKPEESGYWGGTEGFRIGPKSGVGLQIPGHGAKLEGG